MCGMLELKSRLNSADEPRLLASSPYRREYQLAGFGMALERRQVLNGMLNAQFHLITPAAMKPASSQQNSASSTSFFAHSPTSIITFISRNHIGRVNPSKILRLDTRVTAVGMNRITTPENGA